MVTEIWDVQEMAQEMRSMGGQRMIDGSVVGSTVLNLMASSMGNKTYLLAGTGTRTKISPTFINLLCLPSGERSFVLMINWGNECVV